MPIESPFTNITDLNDANPTAGDNVSEGDDHIRGLKTVLLTDFPNINGAVNATPTDLNRTAVAAAGVGAASEVLTADGSGNVDLSALTVTGIAAELGYAGSNFTGTGSSTLGEATNIPAAAQQIIVTFYRLSSSSDSEMYITIGDSTYTATVRASYFTDHTNGANQVINADGRTVITPAVFGSSDNNNGTVTFTKLSGANSWIATGTASGNTVPGWISGVITTSNAVDRVKITCSAGTFDGSSEASVYWSL